MMAELWQYVVGALLVAVSFSYWRKGRLSGKAYEASLFGDQLLLLPSWPVFHTGLHLLAFVELLQRAITPAPLQAIKLATGHLRAHITHTITELNIADALVDGPKAAVVLAAELGLDTERLDRVMQCAVALGIFAQAQGSHKDGIRYRNTPVSAVLRETHPKSVHNLVRAFIFTGTPGIQELTWGLRNKGDMFTHATGYPLFEWLKRCPREEQLYDRGMSESDKSACKLLIADYDWSVYKRVIDIGGCYGSLMAALMVHVPSLQGVLFDQPQVIMKAQTVWAKHDADLRQRAQLIGGDFFKAETLPQAQDGDALVMRFILHDWNDDKAAAILASCRSAIGGTTAHLVLVESLLRGYPYDVVFAPNVLDLHMLATSDGKERSAEQWEHLLSRAGFHLDRITTTRSPFVVIQATPIVY